ncbi:hypothetical protein ACLB2K_020474 [Fragaria x ananassa]
MWNNASTAISNTQLPCVFWNHSMPNAATEIWPGPSYTRAGPSYTRTGTLGWPRLSWSCRMLAGIRDWESATTLGGDDESGSSEPTTDQPNEPYQEESPHVVSDTDDICVNNQHVPVIIGYILVTPSELNSLQRNPNHDADGFIDDEYIEYDEYSDQTEEDDDSDDSNYHESD